MQIDTRPYFPAVEDFLQALQEENVRAICMVALLDDETGHDVLSTWGSGPFEMKACAGVLDLHAALRFVEMNTEDDEEDEEDNDQDST